MTYTALALEPAFSLIGAATASRSLAVGNAVIAIDPVAGAVASQAYTNSSLRGRVLEQLRNGRSCAEALALVPEWDADHSYRQLAAISLSGETAHFTGESCSVIAGGRSSRNLVVVGNLLANNRVLGAMAAAYQSAARGAGGAEAQLASFTRRLADTLRAGEAAGGDQRGRQSAAIQVACFAVPAERTAQLAVDLRVDDSADPLRELDRLIALRFPST